MAGPPGAVEDKNKDKHAYIEEIAHRAYVLHHHDEASLKAIERRLSAGKDIPRKELSDYASYLEHMSYHIKEILQGEKAEGIPNMDLERQLRKILTMLNQVSALVDKF